MAPDKGLPAAQRSDLSSIKKWWRTLGGDGFAVLPPPTRSRYTQSDGHEDAAEMFATRSLPTSTSFAYWHWQSHSAFDRSGGLERELYVHWGGDHATVAAGLGDGPAGYRVIDGGPQGAFGLDKVTEKDDDGLPDPEDTAGVRQFLTRLGTPRSRTARAVEHNPLTAAEESWLHDRLRDPADLTGAAGFVTALEARQALTAEETARLLPAWREEYAGRLTEWPAWAALLDALLRHDHEEVWDTVASLGPQASDALGTAPSPRALDILRGWSLTGQPNAIRAWLAVHRAVHGTDPVRTAGVLAGELTAHDAPETSLSRLFGALSATVTDDWRAAWPTENHTAAKAFAALTAVRLATDEDLPRPLRVAAALRAYDQVDHVREQAALYVGVTEAEVLAAADRYDAARDDLLAGTGPELTGYEGRLGDIYHRYRTLAPADLQWLRDRVADPSTGVQGIAFCLELLHAHGEAGEAELTALLPRWKKELTKQYRTTYTEWRHPLVTLTCLAQDLGHPAAEAMLAWWAKPKPLWKTPVRLLTHLGAPDETKAAELWDFVVSGAHDTGHLMTWVLLRARLDGTHPLLVAERLIGQRGIRAYVLNRVLIGVADPAQPLWHYDIDPRSHSWLLRAQEVADDPRLTEAARAIGLKTVREHYVFRYPDQVSPPLTDGQLAAAHAWAEARAGRTAAD
ncbi:hypothetical protein AMK17_34360 [Streptomyces sp. CB00072]|uniref:hypothetical protein n=1 Tax=Streptomyces sp. CB00072 TaxID=1703928 RepID=UPI0009395C4E|nr:hypothetical protein [Streptomyces sp. CB00072]OKI51337.1 hypothetical protein AMK17_34360 [Streptomyces sp. CB00072]